MELHKHLHNIVKGLMTMNIYVKDIITIYEKLNAVSQDIDESVIVFSFLRGLLSKYTSFITGLNAYLKNPSLDDTNF